MMLARVRRPAVEAIGLARRSFSSIKQVGYDAFCVLVHYIPGYLAPGTPGYKIHQQQYEWAREGALVSTLNFQGGWEYLEYLHARINNILKYLRKKSGNYSYFCVYLFLLLYRLRSAINRFLLD